MRGSWDDLKFGFFIDLSFFQFWICLSWFWILDLVCLVAVVAAVSAAAVPKGGVCLPKGESVAGQQYNIFFFNFGFFSLGSFGFWIWYFWSLLSLLSARQPCRKVGYACRKVSVSHNNSNNLFFSFFFSLGSFGFWTWYFLLLLVLLLERQPCRKVGYACRKVSVSHNNSNNFFFFIFFFLLVVLDFGFGIFCCCWCCC